MFFTAIVLAALPALFVGVCFLPAHSPTILIILQWIALGANVNHIAKAFGHSPISHGLFFGSIVAMEGIFFMYYTTWNLFQTLPPALGVAVIIFLSGSRALSEVQERRVAGLR